MTKLQEIVKKAKALKKAYPKKYSKWTDYIKAASKSISGYTGTSKSGNKTTVHYTNAKATTKKPTTKQGKLFGTKTHKDTKSHNVNVKVVSGVGNVGENFTRVNNDANGNPRYVVHFMDVLNSEERISIPFSKMYQYAVKKANKIGGKKYNNKSYGGGIVFQSYNLQKTWNDIQNIKNTNPKIKI